MLTIHDTNSSQSGMPLRRWKRAILLCLVACSANLGCEAEPASNSTSKETPAAAGKKNSTAKTAKKSSIPKVTQDADGRKSLDGIPYDVWFDDPLSIVANTTVAPKPVDSGSSSPDTKSPAPAPGTSPEPTVAATSGDGDWANYIATEQLLEETKKLRNHLKGLLQTQVQYGENFEVIKMDGAVMAALAGIVTEVNDTVNWKANAPYIRDYGWELVDSAKGLGKPNYDKTGAAYENMQAVFSGSIPAGASEPAAHRPFPEVAPRYYVMKRMKLAYNALKLNINTEEKLKSAQEEALHEAMVLAALTKVVSLKDYGSADESDYQQFMQEILQQCQTAIAAVKDQQFDKFSESLNVIDKACLNCHSQYKE